MAIIYLCFVLESLLVRISGKSLSNLSQELVVETLKVDALNVTRDPLIT